MPNLTTWWPWVQRNLDAYDLTNADLARATRDHGDPVDVSVIGRWRNHGAEPTIPSVRVVATVFKRDIRDALIAAGLLTAEELHAPWVKPDDADLTAVPDEVILAELQRRMTSGRRRSRATAARRQQLRNGKLARLAAE